MAIANSNKYLGKINYTYLTPLLPLASCLLPIFTRKLILHDYLMLKARLRNISPLPYEFTLGYKNPRDLAMAMSAAIAFKKGNKCLTINLNLR
ncbi:hypothetical protein ED562_14120 [Microcystis aeruginosa FACHB-524]|nr:hypothetical protein ED562_14120 [Microcystis aeruginosa FACHB-524]